MQGNTLKSYLDVIASAEAQVAKTWAPDDPLLAADLHEQIFMNLSQGYVTYFHSTPDHPEFGPLFNSIFRLQPNPDDTYCRAPLEANGVYRISGNRGSVRLLTFTLTGDIIGMDEAPGRQTAEYDLDDHLEFHPNGDFEVILSATKPDGCDGNWLHMPEKTRCVIVRQRSYKWGEEREAPLAIERLDTPIYKKRDDLKTLETKLSKLAAFAERHTRQWLAYQDQMRAKGLINRIEHHGFSDLGGIKVQVYWWGIFEMESDEALILETDVPENAGYWNIQLNDQIWNAIDYVWRQSSLNGSQAVIDSDGKFRAVLSVADPGIPNWLDTGGRTQGSIVGRWYKCKSAPVPKITKVKLSELKDHLPADTPPVSESDRVSALRARARGAQLRRRW